MAASFVMVGKTFKGLTDKLLAWQTERFLARKTGEEGIVVHVRPELVVEIALDGVQRSTRYPGGRGPPIREGPPVPRRQVTGRCRHDRRGPGPTAVSAGEASRP